MKKFLSKFGVIIVLAILIIVVYASLYALTDLGRVIRAAIAGIGMGGVAFLVIIKTLKSAKKNDNT